ncbi:phospholipase A [Dysgonomonas macrotermitis]|uniref:Phosphatidylcholine 1-acylhydrolase n=1 Tax=Dysgonomonas macrotermitis TaxID=1346286 RepID=A0A1M4WNL7_9BACT|nr:phospholipase A [Dysgonomonas macrotermitis]SHE82836.1 phospholipase A1 [Dysgonomonas macrotermitis]
MKRDVLRVLFIALLALVGMQTGYAQKHTRAVNDSTKSHSSFTSRTDEVLERFFKPDPEFLADSLIKAFDDTPSFGIYKDNYIVLGSDLLRNPDRNNSDAKFQISVMQRLTNSILPFKTYLFLTYTQLAIWDVFKESFPFRDLNFNPTVGLGKPLIHNNRYLGDISFQLEHESNGKDSIASRSWNKISFSGQFKINRHWSYFGKVWIPFVDGENNKDLVHYKGWGTFAVSYNQRDKYNVSLVVNPRSGFMNANITLNCSYRIFSDENQYLFFELYNGYGENLLDYDKFHQRFRLGFVIKPNFRFIY